MLIQSCPSESDPRDKVTGFVSDRNIGSIGGLRTDGMQFLIDLVKGEIEKQEPDSRIVMLDRDFLIDNSEPAAGASPEEVETQILRQKDRLRQMTFYCHSRYCLRGEILKYFGQRTGREGCGACGSTASGLAI